MDLGFLARDTLAYFLVHQASRSLRNETKLKSSCRSILLTDISPLQYIVDNSCNLLGQKRRHSITNLNVLRCA